MRLFAHGAWRRVTVDDRLPLAANNVPLLLGSKDPLELWPLLLAKALYKLHGGAAVGGGADARLHALTGWLPERDGTGPGGDWALLARAAPRDLDRSEPAADDEADLAAAAAAAKPLSPTFDGDSEPTTLLNAAPQSASASSANLEPFRQRRACSALALAPKGSSRVPWISART